MPRVSVGLQHPETLFCTYSAQFFANITSSKNTAFQPQSSLVEQDTLYIATRLLASGKPMRQSASQASAATALGASVYTVAGAFVQEFQAEMLSIALQWKTVAPGGRNHWSTSALDGTSLTRSLVCKVQSNVQHHFTLETELLRASSKWQPLPGLQRILPPFEKPSHLRFGILLRPLPFQSRDLSQAAISVRVLLDGTPLVGAAAYYRSVTRSLTLGFLQGEGVLGSFNRSKTLSLQYATKGRNSWLMDSSMFEGFGGSSGFTLEPAQAVVGSTLQSRLTLPSNTSGWHSVNGGLQSVTIPVASFMDLSFSVNLLKFGDPSSGVWNWREWGYIQLALFVDGELHPESVTTAGSTVKTAFSVRGRSTARLAAGGHAIQVKWRPSDEATNFWSAIHLSMRSYAAASIVTAVVNVVNEAPKIRFSEGSLINVFEDQGAWPSFGARVTDRSSRWMPEMEIELQVSTKNCSLTKIDPEVRKLFEETKSLVESASVVSVRGTLQSVNAVLAGFRCVPEPNFHGNATVQLFVNDLGNVGRGGGLQAQETLTFVFHPVNDPIRVTAPGSLAMRENGTLTLKGIAILDHDATYYEEMEVSLNLSPKHGTLQWSLETSQQAKQLDVELKHHGLDVALTGQPRHVSHIVNQIQFRPCEFCNDLNTACSLKYVATDLSSFGRSESNAFFDSGTNSPSLEQKTPTFSSGNIVINVTAVNNRPELSSAQSIEVDVRDLLILQDMNKDQHLGLGVELSISHLGQKTQNQKQIQVPTDTSRTFWIAGGRSESTVPLDIAVSGNLLLQPPEIVHPALLAPYGSAVIFRVWSVVGTPVCVWEDYATVPAHSVSGDGQFQCNSIETSNTTLKLYLQWQDQRTEALRLPVFVASSRARVSHGQIFFASWQHELQIPTANPANSQSVCRIYWDHQNEEKSFIDVSAFQVGEAAQQVSCNTTSMQLQLPVCGHPKELMVEYLPNGVDFEGTRHMFAVNRPVDAVSRELKYVLGGAALHSFKLNCELSSVDTNDAVCIYSLGISVGKFDSNTSTLVCGPLVAKAFESEGVGFVHGRKIVLPALNPASTGTPAFKTSTPLLQTVGILPNNILVSLEQPCKSRDAFEALWATSRASFQLDCECSSEYAVSCTPPKHPGVYDVSVKYQNSFPVAYAKIRMVAQPNIVAGSGNLLADRPQVLLLQSSGPLEQSVQFCRINGTLAPAQVVQYGEEVLCSVPPLSVGRYLVEIGSLQSFRDTNFSVQAHRVPRVQKATLRDAEGLISGQFVLDELVPPEFSARCQVLGTGSRYATIHLSETVLLCHQINAQHHSGIELVLESTHNEVILAELRRNASKLTAPGYPSHESIRFQACHRNRGEVSNVPERLSYTCDDTKREWRGAEPIQLPVSAAPDNRVPLSVSSTDSAAHFIMNYTALYSFSTFPKVEQLACVLNGVRVASNISDGFHVCRLPGLAVGTYTMAIQGVPNPNIRFKSSTVEVHYHPEPFASTATVHNAIVEVDLTGPKHADFVCVTPQGLEAPLVRLDSSRAICELLRPAASVRVCAIWSAWCSSQLVLKFQTAEPFRGAKEKVALRAVTAANFSSSVVTWSVAQSAAEQQQPAFGTPISIVSWFPTSILANESNFVTLYFNGSLEFLVNASCSTESGARTQLLAVSAISATCVVPASSGTDVVRLQVQRGLVTENIMLNVKERLQVILHQAADPDAPGSAALRIVRGMGRNESESIQCYSDGTVSPPTKFVDDVVFCPVDQFHDSHVALISGGTFSNSIFFVANNNTAEVRFRPNLNFSNAFSSIHSYTWLDGSATQLLLHGFDMSEPLLCRLPSGTSISSHFISATMQLCTWTRQPPSDLIEIISSRGTKELLVPVPALSHRSVSLSSLESLYKPSSMTAIRINGITTNLGSNCALQSELSNVQSLNSTSHVCLVRHADELQQLSIRSPLNETVLTGALHNKKEATVSVTAIKFEPSRVIYQLRFAPGGTRSVSSGCGCDGRHGSFAHEGERVASCAVESACIGSDLCLLNELLKCVGTVPHTKAVRMVLQARVPVSIEQTSVLFSLAGGDLRSQSVVLRVDDADDYPCDLFDEQTIRCPNPVSSVGLHNYSVHSTADTFPALFTQPILVESRSPLQCAIVQSHAVSSGNLDVRLSGWGATDGPVHALVGQLAAQTLTLYNDSVIIALPDLPASLSSVPVEIFASGNLPFHASCGIVGLFHLPELLLRKTNAVYRFIVAETSHFPPAALMIEVDAEVRQPCRLADAAYVCPLPERQDVTVLTVKFFMSGKLIPVQGASQTTVILSQPPSQTPLESALQIQEHGTPMLPGHNLDCLTSVICVWVQDRKVVDESAAILHSNTHYSCSSMPKQAGVYTLALSDIILGSFGATRVQLLSELRLNSIVPSIVQAGTTQTLTLRVQGATSNDSYVCFLKFDSGLSALAPASVSGSEIRCTLQVPFVASSGAVTLRSLATRTEHTLRIWSFDVRGVSLSNNLTSFELSGLPVAKRNHFRCKCGNSLMEPEHRNVERLSFEAVCASDCEMISLDENHFTPVLYNKPNQVEVSSLSPKVAVFGTQQLFTFQMSHPITTPQLGNDTALECFSGSKSSNIDRFNTTHFSCLMEVNWNSDTDLQVRQAFSGRAVAKLGRVEALFIENRTWPILAGSPFSIKVHVVHRRPIRHRLLCQVMQHTSRAVYLGGHEHVCRFSGLQSQQHMLPVLFGGHTVGKQLAGSIVLFNLTQPSASVAANGEWSINWGDFDPPQDCQFTVHAAGFHSAAINYQAGVYRAFLVPVVQQTKLDRRSLQITISTCMHQVLSINVEGSLDEVSKAELLNQHWDSQGRLVFHLTNTALGSGWTCDIMVADSLVNATIIRTTKNVFCQVSAAGIRPYVGRSGFIRLTKNGQLSFVRIPFILAPLRIAGCVQVGNGTVISGQGLFSQPQIGKCIDTSSLVDAVLSPLNATHGICRSGIGSTITQVQFGLTASVLCPAAGALPTPMPLLVQASLYTCTSHSCVLGFALPRSQQASQLYCEQDGKVTPVFHKQNQSICHIEKRSKIAVGILDAYQLHLATIQLPTIYLNLAKVNTRNSVSFLGFVDVWVTHEHEFLNDGILCSFISSSAQNTLEGILVEKNRVRCHANVPSGAYKLSLSNGKQAAESVSVIVKEQPKVTSSEANCEGNTAIFSLEGTNFAVDMPFRCFLLKLNSTVMFVVEADILSKNYARCSVPLDTVVLGDEKVSLSARLPFGAIIGESSISNSLWKCQQLPNTLLLPASGNMPLQLPSFMSQSRCESEIVSMTVVESEAPWCNVSFSRSGWLRLRQGESFTASIDARIRHSPVLLDVHPRQVCRVRRLFPPRAHRLGPREWL